MSTFDDIKKFANELYPGHQHELPYLLCAWTRVNPGNELGNIFRDAGSNIHVMIDAYEQLLNENPMKEDSLLLESCILKYDLKELTGFHLLLTICNTPESRIYSALSAANVDIGKLAAILGKRIEELKTNRTNKFPTQNSISEIDPSLANYGRDLTSIALKGEFDGLAERDEEINNILNVLLKKDKRNVVLTGPAGVGKTSIAQLLARKISLNEIPSLKGGCIFEINIGKVVAGTKYRGDFEKRVYGILEAVQNHENIIIFVDEFHLLMGAGSAEGINTDASNLMKPYLTGNTLQVIGATTHEEYEYFVKRDLALERRFQEIKLKRPDMLTTKRMLSKQAEVLEAYHGVYIPVNLKSLVVDLAHRYISARNCIDNSMDLLDTSLAHAKRNGETELTREILYSTLSLMAGRKLNPPESNLFNSWIREFKKKIFLKTADVFILGNNIPKATLDIMQNFLRRTKLLLNQKGIELIFDEGRLLQYIVSKVGDTSRKSTSIFYLLETLILKPLAVKILDENEIEIPGRYILDDDFYSTGEVKQIELTIIENRTDGILM